MFDFLFDNVFYHICLFLLWCSVSLILSYIGQKMAESSTQYIIPFIIGFALYALSTIVGIDDKDNEMIFSSVLGLIVLIIAFIRSIKRRSNLN